MHYLLTDDLDVRNFRRGIAELVRMHEAAGAEQILSMARTADVWRRGDDLAAFTDSLTSHSLAPREFAVFSAHQMGSCRMGSDPSTSVADPFGRAPRHARACGSATPARSRAPPVPTR